MQQSGLGHRVEEQIERLDAARWLSHGDDGYEARCALGMRLVREADGYIDEGVIAQTSLIERQVFARLMEDQIELLRILAYRLIKAEMTRADDAFECNDGRDSAWAETVDGQINPASAQPVGSLYPRVRQGSDYPHLERRPVPRGDRDARMA